MAYMNREKMQQRRGPPMEEDPVEIAILKVGEGLDRYDMDRMRASEEPPGEAMGEEGMEGPENCPDCKAGMCMKPEHLSDEDMQAMMSQGE